MKVNETKLTWRKVIAKCCANFVLGDFVESLLLGSSCILSYVCRSLRVRHLVGIHSACLGGHRLFSISDL